VKNRGRTEIVATILESAGSRFDGVSTTKIANDASTSYSQINRYLKLLMKERLLDRDVKSKKYIITEKGRTFLDLYHNMTEMFQFPNSK
jgi:predicted transcriptional regulator